MNSETQSINSNINELARKIEPNQLEKLPDAKLKDLVKRCAALNENRTFETFKKLVELILSTAGAGALLNKNFRFIEGAKYEIKVEPNTALEEEYLLEIIYEKLHETMPQQLVADLEQRLTNLSEKEQLERLENELEDINDMKSNKYFLAGYKAGRSGKKVSIYYPFHKNNSTKKNYKACVNGIINCQLEQTIKQKIATICENGQPKYFSEHLSHKILFLKAIGALDSLYKEHGNKFSNSVDFAKIIAATIGADVEQESGLIKRYIDQLVLNMKPTGNNNVLTMQALKKVQSVLADLGLEAEYIDKKITELKQRKGD